MKTVYITVALALLFTIPGHPQAQATTCLVPMGIICLGEDITQSLECLPDYRFDKTYMFTMYQLNSDIAALAAYGLDNASDPDIRLFSRKIAMERMDVRNDLKRWYWQYNNRIMPEPETARQELLLAALSGCCGADFDCRYAQLIIELMMQSRDAAELAIERTDNMELLFQARVAKRTNENEIRAFQRWLNTGALRQSAR